MSTPRHLPALIAAALSLVGCNPAPPPPEPPVLDAAALTLIDRLDDYGPSMTMQGDEVLEPKEFGLLVTMGALALPTILHVVETTPDSWTRSRLIDIAGRIGDPRARPLLERLLRSPDRDAQSEAIDAIGRLGIPESLPALRELLATLPPEAGLTRVRVFEACLRVGELSVIGDLLHIALTDRDQRFSAICVLLRHPPLRAALGLAPYHGQNLEFVDRVTFVRAADEWYRETVLAQPSPWRPKTPEFTPPFAAEKAAAFASLEQAVRGDNDEHCNLRVHARDPRITAEDGERTLTLISGWGHGSSLAIWVWRPGGEVVRGHRFVLQGRAQRTGFPEDLGAVGYATVTIAPSEYRSLVAGLRTTVEAKLMAWWAGPTRGSSFSSANFTISFAGLDGTSPTRFCGYKGSSDRLRYAGLRAATGLHDRFTEGKPLAATDLTPQAKHLFSELFRREQSAWAAGGDSWWWVRERMVSMARDCGDDTLREPLAQYLAPEYVSAPHSRSRTAAKAVTALAAITGTDLRFAADGTPRPVAEVAAAYRELLAR